MCLLSEPWSTETFSRQAFWFARCLRFFALQSIEAITAIVKEAQQTEETYGYDDNDLIDDAIERDDADDSYYADEWGQHTAP